MHPRTPTIDRFFLRLMLLILFAGLAMLRGQPFPVTLTVLCLLASGLCIGMAAFHREPFRIRSLTNWHEAAGFLLVAGASQTLL